MLAKEFFTSFFNCIRRPKLCLLMLWYCLIFYSCSNNPNNSSIIYIEDSFYEKRVPIASWTKNQKFLKLQTTKDVLMSGVSKLLITDSLIFIFERKQSNIFCFDQNGKFKFKILNLENKHGESFEYIKDIAWDRYHSELYIVDTNANKLYVYSDSGVYLRTIQPKIRPSSIFRVNPKSWVIHNTFTGSPEHPDKLYILDNTFQQVINSAISGDLMSSSITVSNPFIMADSSVHFLQGFDNNIYEIYNDNTVFPKYKIDFGQLNFGDRANTLPRQQIMRTFMRQDFAGIPANYNENAEYIGFTYSRNGNEYLKGSRFVLIKKDNMTTKLSFQKQFLNSIEIPKPIFLHESKFVSVLDFYKINSNDEDFLNSQKMSGRSKSYGWYQSFDSIKHNTKSLDNPILMYYEVK